LFEESLALRRQLGRGAPLDLLLGGQGIVARQQGDLERAAALLGEAVGLSRRIRDLGALVVWVMGLGAVLLSQGKLMQAAAVGDEALQASRDFGDPDALSRAVELVALIALRRGEGRRAVRLLGAVRALRDGLGVALSRVPGTDDDRALEE